MVSPSLDWLRGKPVLVVAEGEGPAQTREAAVTRALTTVPVRAWPGDADASLARQLDDGEAGDSRLDRAREAAEQRRIPWLLVAGDDTVRVETTRSGAVRWVSDPRPGQSPAAVAGLVRTVVGPSEHEGPIDSADVRLVPPSRLAVVRALAVGGSWEDHAAQVAELAAQWPADPAVMVHGALPDLLSESPTGASEAAVRRSVQVNPDGESELLALALMAEESRRLAFALRAREVLVRLFPERIDYRPELADLHGEMGATDRAVSVVRGGLAFVDPQVVEALAAGTAPDEAPLALPYGDLRFSLGWYLAEEGEPEAALLSYEKALEVYEVMGRPREQSDAVNNAGVVLVEAGRPAVAVPLFRKAQRLRAGQGRAGKAANSLHNLARALGDSRRIDEAIETYEAAAEDYLAAGDAFSAIESLYETMEHHAGVGDSEALERRADELLAQLDALEGADTRLGELRGSIWFERAQGRMALGDPEGALEAFTVALDVYRRRGLRLDEAQTLYSMAIPNMAMLRLDDAYRNLMDALVLAVELNDSASIVDIRNQASELAGLIRAAGRVPPPIPDSVVPFME